MPFDSIAPPRPQAASKKCTLAKVAAVTGALALIGVVGLAVSHCTSVRQQPVNPLPAEPVIIRDQLPAVLRREVADEAVPGLQSYDYSAPVDADTTGSAASGAAAARATNDDTPEEPEIPVGVSVPILTQTSLNTIYTIRTLEPNTTSTTTLTTTIVLSPGAATPTPLSTHSCTSSVSDETETVVVTMTVTPEQSHPPAYGSAPDGVTVTGNPATVTDVQTDTHYTSGLPDVTVSGPPATVTDVQTDTHFTTGAPDATVSGEPATVTSVITNTAGEAMTTLTFTSIRTVRVTTVVTHTVSSSSSGYDVESSVLGMTHNTTTSPVFTHTRTVTVTGGEPATSTTTVELPEPYSDEYPTTYGTGVHVNATASPTYVPPPVVTAGADKCGLSVAFAVLAAMASLCLF